MKNVFAGYIAVGKFGRPHGTEGWIPVMVYSGYPDRFQDIKVLFCEVRQQLQGFIILNERIVGNALQMQLKGIENRDDARQVAGKEVFLPESELIELPEDEYFIHDLIGMKVIDEDGALLGKIREVMTAGANDVYVVASKKKEVLIPAVSEFVKNIDRKTGEMVVHLWDEM